MVSIRQVHKQDDVPFKKWLSTLALSDETRTALVAIAGDRPVSDEAREMVEILLELHMDSETLQAALVLPECEANDYPDDALTERFGSGIHQLIQGVRRMAAIRALKHQKSGMDDGQIDGLRRMLLSMVEDVRAVVIKLAERICALRAVKNADEETRVLLARECATIYAPLANRLGIGQLKWELEDLAFRYLHPETYMRIARWLDGKREDREHYIDDFVDTLQQQLGQEQIRAQVYGRPKHIYSIWKKMQKKNLSFDELYDIRAVRVIAERLQDCYGALGIVHANWNHIPQEFDDYIATPKPNGYQSIHTVVVGPEGKSVEIQIRTDQMHQDAELGVAAHWKYKEGASSSRSSFDDKINWLRKILQWQEEMAESGELVEELRSQVFDDRVYVFTPQGDVIDLPQGSTPLDFAYYVHSNVGHRCIGAKVFGRIVPFTYELQTGDQVEILTGKKANPSRDWMNPSLGYVHSSRARAKIHTFFKKQDKDKNRVAGKELLDKELHRANIPIKEAESACERFNMQTLDDLHAAIGAGDVRLHQVVHFLDQRHQPASEPERPIKTRSFKPGKAADSVVVEGVGNLMTQLAGCCNPLPGDTIQGYITQGRGVSVHRSDCDQLQHLLDTHPERTIDVHWSGAAGSAFKVDIRLRCLDRDGILRDITTVLANDKIGLLSVNSQSLAKEQLALISLTIEVADVSALSRLLHRLKQLHGVVDVSRKDQ